MQGLLLQFTIKAADEQPGEEVKRARSRRNTGASVPVELGSPPGRWVCWLLGHYRVDVLSNMESGNDWCSSGGLTSTVAMELGLFQTTQLHTGLHTCDLGTGLLSPHGMSGRGGRCRGGEGRSAPPACPPAAAPHGPHLSYGDCLSAETNVHGHQGHIFQGGVTEF